MQTGEMDTGVEHTSGVIVNGRIFCKYVVILIMHAKIVLLSNHCGGTNIQTLVTTVADKF